MSRSSRPAPRRATGAIGAARLLSRSLIEIGGWLISSGEALRILAQASTDAPHERFPRSR